MAGALAFVAGAPTLAHAQQSGLFPLAPITRERVPCPMEDPVYKLYRQQYFGYHPTCWRRFPAGWGCPSPEAPNPAASFREIPREVPPAEPAAEGRPGSDSPPPANPGDPETPRPRNPQAPGNLPPLPSGERSPFDLDTKPGTPPSASRPAARTPESPEVVGLGDNGPPPATEAPEPVAPPASAGSEASAGNVRGEVPLLALPDPTAGVPSPTPVQAGGFNDPRPQASAAPAQAPRRQSLIGGLFGGLRRR